MKKLFISLTVLFVLVMSACSNGSTDKKNDAKGSKSETITYQTEDGKKIRSSCKSKTRCCIIIIRW